MVCAPPLTVAAEHAAPPLVPFAPAVAAVDDASTPSVPGIATPAVRSLLLMLALPPLTYTAIDEPSEPIPSAFMAASGAVTLSP